MINNRQAGRRRGRGGNGNGSGGGQRQGGNQGRPDSGNRIDNRARGNANQLYEKYKNLARDAQMQGDRVNTEYYLQFADHYFRVLSESRNRFDEQNQNQNQGQRRPRDDGFEAPFTGSFDTGFDDDYGDEGEPIRAGEQGEEPRREEPRREEPRRDRPAENRNGGNRDVNRDRERDGNRDARPADGVRREREPRQDRDEGRRPAPVNGHAEGEERYARPAAPVANDLVETAAAAPVAEQPAEPRRRGRPRRERPEEAPAALEADRLPPALTPTLAVVNEADEVPAAKPRRRRVRAANGGELPTAD